MDFDVILLNFHSWRQIHPSKGNLQLNESVSQFLEASCSIAYFLVLSLDFFGTTPKIMSSTPRGWDDLFFVYILWFFIHQHRLDFWECFEHYCTFISTVWQRNRPGFAALHGIHVVLCFYSVFLSVNVILLVFYVFHFPSYFFLS